DADRDLLQAGEHVQLGEEEVGDAVDPGGVPGDRCVEPAAAAVAPGGDAELVALGAQPLAPLVVQLGRERPGADPGGVGLQDADDLGDPGGADARAGAGAAGGGGGGGDERVGAVVDVEEGALGALQVDVLALVE